MRIYMMVLILFLLNSNNYLLAQNISDQELKLQQLINEALQNNPDYLSAQKGVESAKEQISQAGALPDPMLGISMMNLPVNSFDFDQEPMTGKKISLMQMFPFPGKLGLKQDMAQNQAHALEQQVEELKNKLIKNVKQAYFNLYFIDMSIAIVEKNKALLNQFLSVAQTKYSVGKGLQQDVLKAQVELSKMTDKLISLQQKRKTVVYHLNKLLNRDPNNLIQEVPVLEKSTLKLTEDQLINLGLESRPLLKSWNAMIDKARSAQNLAKRGYFPDISVGVVYTQRDDLKSGMKMYDFFSVEISMNIPIYFFKKQAKHVEEKELDLVSVQDKYQAAKNEVLFQIENALAELKKDAKLIELYETGIIPQASQSLNSALAGYQVDKIDFLTLLNNQMTLFNYEMEYYRILSEHEKTVVELEAAVGKEL